MILFAGGVALALGAFIVVSPTRAARIWGWENFNNMAPKHKMLYLRSFRLMGIVIGLGGILVAVNRIWFH
jgi:hypothetical protein